MSFIVFNRKKESQQLQEESDILGELASDQELKIFDKENVQLDMVKISAGNDVHRHGERNSNIAAFATIASVALFFVLFFSMDVPGKIIKASSPRPVDSASFAPNNERSDVENSMSSPNVFVLQGANMTKEDLLNHLGELSNDDVELILENIQTQQPGTKQHQSEAPTSGTAADSLSSSNAKPGSALDAAVEEKSTFSGQLKGSKRLRLVQDLDSKEYKYYVAEDGDTLLLLSKAFGVSLGQLLELNELHDADVIRAGEILLFPGDTKQPDLSDK
ncbi:LysM peptidoglycan-binding domain-containing protein [Paenibacillus sp. Dod16]|uniref:LysM peptidoglycan-binding domain-containing protein n=1 Tax=Paenibacillus sp. Dod16 TaxID=3416392 RepID=UPI003CEB0370